MYSDCGDEDKIIEISSSDHVHVAVTLYWTCIREILVRIFCWDPTESVYIRPHYVETQVFSRSLMQYKIYYSCFYNNFQSILYLCTSVLDHLYTDCRT
jgi:hypothetical protein